MTVPLSVVRLSSRFLQAVDGCDIGTIQGGEDFSLTLKARQTFRVSSERSRQHFQCHVALQLGIRRPIHLPHSAHADLGGHFIWAEPSAGSEGQTVGV